MQTYKVVVSGELLSGQEPDLVRERVAKLFKTNDPGKLDKLFSGRPRTIKKGISREKAESYRKALIHAGLDCEIEPEAGEGELPLSLVPKEEKETAEEQVMVPGAPSRPEEGQPAPAEPRVESEGAGQGAAEGYNPYQQPKSELGVTQEESKNELELVEPQKLPAGMGWDWIKEGYYYFKLTPGLWIGAVIVAIIIQAALSLIPFVSLIGGLISTLFTAGFMICCYRLYRDEEFEFSDLFAGFKTNTGSIVLAWVLYFGATILIGILLFVLMFGVGGLGQLAAMEENPAAAAAIMGPTFLIFCLLVVGLVLPLFMAFYFAPTLIVLHDLPAIRALKLSFKGCLRNILPFLIYGFVLLFFCIVAAIPLMLGYFVLIPVIIASGFAAYRQIFTESDLEY